MVVVADTVVHVPSDQSRMVSVPFGETLDQFESIFQRLVAKVVRL